MIEHSASYYANLKNDEIKKYLGRKMVAPDIKHDIHLLNDGNILDLITCNNDLYIIFIPNSSLPKEVLFFCSEKDGLVPKFYCQKNGRYLKICRESFTESDLVILKNSYRIGSKSANTLGTCKSQHIRNQIKTYMHYIRRKIIEREVIYDRNH